MIKEISDGWTHSPLRFKYTIVTNIQKAREQAGSQPAEQAGSGADGVFPPLQMSQNEPSKAPPKKSIERYSKGICSNFPHFLSFSENSSLISLALIMD